MPELIDVEPGSPEWLAARRAGVTATDIVTILGLSAHDSVYSLFWRKLGQIEDEPDRDQWALGRHLEPYIAEKWMDARQIPAAHRDGARSALYRSSDRPWQMATPDRVFYDQPAEFKSWADADRKSWEGGPPPAVRAQLLWQMDTLAVDTGYWAVVFLPSGRFEHGVIDHGFHKGETCPIWDDTILMRDAGHEFYRRLTLELPPPDPDSSAATLAALRARFTKSEGKQAEVDGTTFAAWSDARDVQKWWEDQAREYEIILRDQAQEADVLTVDGEPVARRLVFDSPVKAHMDYYRRVKAKDEDNAGS
jgi:putative phage-type endonuclease